jgi:hypothetical protein
MAVLWHHGFNPQFDGTARWGFDLDETDLGVPAFLTTAPFENAADRYLHMPAYNTGTRDFGLSMLCDEPGTLHLGGLMRINFSSGTSAANPVRFLAIFVNGNPVLNFALNGNAIANAGIDQWGIGLFDEVAFDIQTLNVADLIGTTPRVRNNTGSANEAIWWQIVIERGASDGSVTIRTQDNVNLTFTTDTTFSGIAELALSAGPIDKVMYRGQQNGNQTLTTTRTAAHTHLWADDARPLGRARSVYLPLVAQGNYDDAIPSVAPVVDNFDLVNEAPPDLAKSLTFASVADRESYELDGSPTQPLLRSQVAAITPRIHAVLSGSEELTVFVREGVVDASGGDPLTGSGVAENLYTPLNLNPHGGFWTPTDITDGIELGFERTD